MNRGLLGILLIGLLIVAVNGSNRNNNNEDREGISLQTSIILRKYALAQQIQELNRILRDLSLSLDAEQLRALEEHEKKIQDQEAGGIFGFLNGVDKTGAQTGTPTQAQASNQATIGSAQGVIGNNIGDSTGARLTLHQTSAGDEGGMGGIPSSTGENPNTGESVQTGRNTQGGQPVEGITLFTTKAGNPNGLLSNTVVTAAHTLANVIGGRSSGGIAASLGAIDQTVGQVLGGTVGSIGQTGVTNQATLANSVASLLAGSRTGSSSLGQSIGNAIGGPVQTVGNVISGPDGTIAHSIGQNLGQTVVGDGGSVGYVIAGNFHVLGNIPFLNHAVMQVTGVTRELSWGYEPNGPNSLLEHLIQNYPKENQDNNNENNN